MLHASYIKPALDLKSFPKIIRLLSWAIIKYAPDAQAVAFRGASGTLVGMSLCRELRLPPILIRKAGCSHSLRRAEGEIEATKIAIVDDMIQSGKTIRAILNGILLERRYQLSYELDLKCLGAFFYKELIDSSSHCFPNGLTWRKQIIPIRGVRKSLENFRK